MQKIKRFPLMNTKNKYGEKNSCKCEIHLYIGVLECKLLIH